MEPDTDRNRFSLKSSSYLRMLTDVLMKADKYILIPSNGTQYKLSEVSVRSTIGVLLSQRHNVCEPATIQARVR